jgi:signal transduction histidine kinase/ligand-binding sensor domain-containing protein/DNA-binding NarL/FixJ family response regulator
MGSAQNQDNLYAVQKINTKDGLINNYVTRVVSDQMNIKWIATAGGLTKYNGKNYTHYKPGNDYPEFLNENIETLFLDKKNNLWIGTKSGGVCKLDIVTGFFKNYQQLLKPVNNSVIRVMSITQDSRGHIWLGTWHNGIYVISTEESETLIKHIPSEKPVLEILHDSFGSTWFEISGKLKKYNVSNDTFTEFDLGNSVCDIIEDKKRGRIWITTYNEDFNFLSKNNSKSYVNLNYFDYKKQTIENIAINVKTNYASYLALDKDNNLFIGTWGNGLYKSNKNLTQFHKITFFKNPREEDNIINQTILDIHIDNNNLIWLSMAYGSVIKLTQVSGFFNASQSVVSKGLPKDFNIQAIYKDDKNFWLGTSQSGLLKGSKLSNLKSVEETIGEKVYSIYKYKNLLFVGQEFGVKVYDLSTEQIVMKSSVRKATAFLVDEKQRLWIGTQEDGLALVGFNDFQDTSKYMYFNLKTKKLKTNRIGQILFDEYTHKIWLASFNGFYYFDEASKKFIHNDVFLKDKLPSVIVNEIYIEKDELWLATPNGLVRIKKDADLNFSITSVYNKSSGLKNDFVCSIEVDIKNNLWFSTMSEIVKYDRTINSFIAFNEIHGIATASFNNRSHFKSNEGKLFFGGIDDITFFDPSHIKKLGTHPELILSELRVNNELVQPRFNLDNFEIDNNIEYLKTITLSYKEKSMQLGFVLNDYLGDLNATYRYKLEGLDEDWVELKGNNTVNFSELSSGNYTLHLQGSRNKRDWSSKNSLKIKVAAKPWLTWWAYLIYLSIFSFVFYLFAKMKIKQSYLRRNLELAKTEKEKEAQLVLAKLSFFTNISHEFRTPLTLIAGPLEELILDKSIMASNMIKLETMHKNTNRLLNLVKQLLDFRKAEKGKLELRVADGNFVRFAKEVFLYFKELAKSKNIDYEFIASNNTIKFFFDRVQMEIVLSNLLSNAFKNTDVGGKITLKIAIHNDTIQIVVGNTGKPINIDEINNIFNRYYQIKDTTSAKIVGSGIGLSFSKEIVELHKGDIIVKNKNASGVEFIVNIPLKSEFSNGNVAHKSVNTELIENYEEVTISPINSKSKSHKVATSILIVDDNDDIRKYLQSIFEQDYKVFLASDGEEGLETAIKQVPDIIISDVMMPRKDGLELCKDLKNNIVTSHVPIIMLTARTASVYEIEGLQNGADAYVTKPFNPNLIKARVQSILKTRKKIQQFYQNKVRFGPNDKVVQENDSTDDKFLTELIVFVESNINDENFGVDQLREKLFMSKSALYRKLKSLTGLSPTAFVRSIRLKKAAEMILNSDYKLNYIALEVGFNDYKYFSISFQSQFNCLPSEYKNSIT